MKTVHCQVCQQYFEGFSQVPEDATIEECFRCKGQMIVPPVKFPEPFFRMCAACSLAIARESEAAYEQLSPEQRKKLQALKPLTRN